MPARREVLAAVGSIGSASLAGCTLTAPFRDPSEPPEIDDWPADWPTYNQDSTNTGTLAVQTTPRQAPAIAWRTPVDAATQRMRTHYPVVHNDLLVYPDSQILRAFDAATGTQRWQATGPGPKHAEADSPASVLSIPTITVGSKRRIVVGAPGAPPTLRAYTPAGALAWQRPTPAGGQLIGAPTYDYHTDALYVGTTAERLLRVDVATGTIEWTQQVFGAIEMPVAVTERHVYVVAGGGVYAIDPATGRGIWHTDLNTELKCPPSVSSDDDIYDLYVVGDDGTLYALENTSGAIRWQTNLSNIGWSVPMGLSVGAGHVFSTHGPKSGLSAVNARNGRRAWTFDMQISIPPTVPVVAGEGAIDTRRPQSVTIYVPTLGEIIALRLDTAVLEARERWRWTPDHPDAHIFGLVATTDGRLIVPLQREQEDRAELLALE